MIRQILADATARLPTARQSLRDGTTPCDCIVRVLSYSVARGSFLRRSSSIEAETEQMFNRLKKCQPPLASRIVAVADSFDAMTSSRPYRAGMSIDEAFDQLQRGAGTQFDPECSRAFRSLRRRLTKLVPISTPAPSSDTAAVAMPEDSEAACIPA